MNLLRRVEVQGHTQISRDAHQARAAIKRMCCVFLTNLVPPGSVLLGREHPRLVLTPLNLLTSTCGWCWILLKRKQTLSREYNVIGIN